MIPILKRKLVKKSHPSLLSSARGWDIFVEYFVAPHFSKIGGLGERQLYTHLQVKEIPILVGFSEKGPNVRYFRLLLSVSRIGLEV